MKFEKWEKSPDVFFRPDTRRAQTGCCRFVELLARDYGVMSCCPWKRKRGLPDWVVWLFRQRPDRGLNVAYGCCWIFMQTKTSGKSRENSAHYHAITILNLPDLPGSEIYSHTDTTSVRTSAKGITSVAQLVQHGALSFRHSHVLSSKSDFNFGESSIPKPE